MKSKRILRILSILLVTVIFTGCQKTAETPNVIITKEKERISYDYATVVKDDVTLIGRITCRYKQTNQEEISFSITGKYVDKVHVKEGDYVNKGDILVELSTQSLANDIERLEYNLSKNRLQLGYLDKAEYFDTQNCWMNFLKYSGRTSDDEKNTKEAVAAVHERYEKQRESYLDKIEFDELELKAKKKEYNQSRIFASMSGTVYKIMRGLKGSTSKDGEVIMTIIDNSEGLFESTAIEYKDYYENDKVYSLSVSNSSGTNEIEVKPYKMDEWTDTMYFSILSAPDNVQLEMGSFATMVIDTEARYNVLCLPVGVVYEADGKKFVYVVNESNNMREVKWIETGLKGNTYIEIISGLNEGDKVVKK